tara:strand:+ start:23944 stop:27360 length:3417 start_codon:yes stop_codon:yes gene_type:complete
MDPELEKQDDALPGPSSIGNSTFARETRDAQQSLGDTFKDQIKTGAAADLYRYYDQEAGAWVDQDASLVDRMGQSVVGTIAATLGIKEDGTDFDQEKYRQELTENLPIHLHDDVLGMPTLESARRRAERYRKNAERDYRLSKQTGLDSAAVQFLGSMVDLDLPLILASGGTLAGVKTAAAAQRAAKAVGLGPRMARVAGDAAVGATGGAIAGTLTGSVEALTTDSSDWADVSYIAMMSSIAGAGLGAGLGQIIPDRLLHQRAAGYNMRRELLDGIERNKPEFNQLVDYSALPDNAVQVTPRQGPVLIEEGVEDAAADSLSAAAATTVPRGPTITMNMDGMTPSQRDLSTRMHEWRFNSGFDIAKQDEMASYWTRVAAGADESVLGSAMGKVLNVSTSDWSSIYKSKSPSANYAAAEIFESASGVGRMTSTAAVHNEGFLTQQAVHTAQQLPKLRKEWKKRSGYSVFDTDGDVAFQRALLLEMQARADGKTAGNRLDRIDPEVKDAADALDKSFSTSAQILRGRKADEAVEGAEELQHYSGYVPYLWSGRRMIEVAKLVGDKAVKKALAQGYIARGTFLSQEDAEKVANAVYKRFTDRARGVDAADARVMDIDNRTSIENSLLESGMPEAEVTRLMQGLTANAAERSKQGNLKTRNDIDLRTKIEGTDLALVDLMSANLDVNVAQYQRRVAGSAALARKGIRSKADRTQLIETIMREQEALGETVMDRGRLEAMFSAFDGGPRQGYTRGFGKNDGVDPYMGMLQRATRASLLQQLGLTQLMDFANSVAMNGVARSMDPIIDTITNRATKKDLNAFMEELEGIGVIVGKDHHLFTPHLNLDEVRNQDAGGFLKYAQPLMGNIERMTSYASGFYHIQSLQQKSAASGITHNLMRRIKEVEGVLTPGRNGELADRIIRDFGLDTEDVSEIFDLINKGVIDVDGKYVKLNSNQWSDKLRENFGVGVLRSVNQQVQKGMAGESSAWMSSYMGSLLTQLKTFGLLALQKQLVRNIRVQRSQAYIPALWQLGFGYSVLSIRDKLNDKERSFEDRARLAAVYNPMLGGVAMAIDPVSSMLGFDDFNVSPYGNYASFISVPATETVDRLLQAPGAIRKWASGDDDWEDRRNMRSMFFMNLYGMQRILD